MVTVTKNQDDQVKTGADDGDHVESLDSIAKLGTALDAPAAAPGAPGQTVAASTAADTAEIAAALSLLRAAALPFAPEHVQEPLNLVWRDKQLEKIAAAVVEICHLNGWTTGDFFDRYGPYIQLCMALGIPALATLKLLKMQPPPKPADGQQQ